MILSPDAYHMLLFKCCTITLFRVKIRSKSGLVSSGHIIWANVEQSYATDN